MHFMDKADKTYMISPQSAGRSTLQITNGKQRCTNVKVFELLSG